MSLTYEAKWKQSFQKFSSCSPDIPCNSLLSDFTHVEPPAATFQTLAQDDVTEQSIRLRWDAPAGGADTYELTWEITNVGLSSAQTVTGLTGTCEYSIHNLTIKCLWQQKEFDVPMSGCQPQKKLPINLNMIY